MTRQSLSQLHISPLRLQQGLFASLALMVTLIGGQQWQQWQEGHQSAPHIERLTMTQSQFRPAGNAAAVASTPRFMAVEQDATVSDLPYQERWVF
ncbi:MAG: hypothetical protein GAK37_00165 [Pseudomonas sp.]|nr:MAG: hypothetical protein GAK37_00165 [Pseudomonas sp.]